MRISMHVWVAVVVIELVAMTGLYIFGSHGLWSQYGLKKYQVKISQEIEQLQQQIETLQSDIRSWNTCFFYQEQIAREQLHMAYPHETIFVVTNKK